MRRNSGKNVKASRAVERAALSDPSKLTPEQRVAFARKVFRRDLFAFAKHCLGYDKLYEPHEEWATEYQRFISEFQARTPGYSKRELRIMPRGTYKSTLFTVAGALHILVNDPNARILLLCGSERNAKNFLHEIKSHVTQNERFRSCFGKWDRSAASWTTTSVIFSCRRTPRKEPSIFAVGKGSEITSMHFDYALVDDLVTRDDRDSASARESSRTTFQDLESIMDSESVVSLVGTHWHYDDAYMWIRGELNRKLAAEGKQQWRVFVESPFEADGHTERFKRILPDLDEIKIKRGLVDYYANYIGTPMPPDTQLFPESSLALFQFAVEDYRGLQAFAFWDPASTKQAAGKDPDYHAILVGVVRDGYLDIVDVWMKQDKPSAAYAQAVTMARAYGIATFGVETNHLPDAADTLNDKFRMAGISSGVVGVHNTASKDSRIQQLEPRTSGGRIRFRADWRECSTSYRLFVEQLTMYPVASHDDGPDALVGLWDIAMGGYVEPAELVVGHVDEDGVFTEEDITSIWSRGTAWD